MIILCFTGFVDVEHGYRLQTIIDQKPFSINGTLQWHLPFGSII